MKHYCHNCGSQIDAPEKGAKVVIYGVLFYITTCLSCDTEHQFTKELNELVCHAIQKGGK